MKNKNRVTIDHKTKLKAFIEKRHEFDGVFVTAVKTTGIFCKPSCSARKPKIENIVFFNSAQEALQNGFRPCKLCLPMQHPGETPEFIQEIMQRLNDYPYNKIKDQDLRNQNIEPNKVRRWFKKNLKMTFQTYQRLLRINNAYEKLHQGKTITETAFDVGYESLSGFTDQYKSVFKVSPSETKFKNVLHITRITTPIGPMFLCASKRGICLLEFTDRRMLETEFNDLQKKCKAIILPGENIHIVTAKKQLNEYFEGTRTTFSVKLDTPGTDFQKKVWEALLTIPYGYTKSYKEQASFIGNPQAVRAVASANGHNRVAIIIPCHRVIGEDGKLVGYAGGLPRKKWLLDFENNVKKNLDKQSL